MAVSHAADYLHAIRIRSIQKKTELHSPAIFRRISARHAINSSIKDYFFARFRTLPVARGGTNTMRQNIFNDKRFLILQHSISQQGLFHYLKGRLQTHARIALASAWQQKTPRNPRRLLGLSPRLRTRLRPSPARCPRLPRSRPPNRPPAAASARCRNARWPAWR